ncbi:PREDICTED: DNA-directed RNA polymerase I subunit 1 [Nelumbo nucifera]|uniref:DNA-directed RNA polymerase subunit n=2 Tax=Nelumbo nucifera TaxID=4432 RepID=A0A1U7ZE36_NELNU|nr:PREDICTED: DNA-directed RNA polymerase I subunit 1 [Nelumbo nucifera]DAD42999.1 TPA_asm: hypothetical protein HUJ06_001229 [Nelumbo nucifera]
MAHVTEGATEHVEAVRFSFLTDEEVRNLSFKKITNPTIFDNVERPLPGGLYDPALGPLDDRTPCQSCGQRSFHCPGHCGHIDLVLPVYNPLLFKILFALLQRVCFFCHKFKAKEEQVQKYASQLELIIKGDVAGAKNLESVLASESSFPDKHELTHKTSESSSLEENDLTHKTDTAIHSVDQNCNPMHLQEHHWTSLQYKEAMSVLGDFMKDKHSRCQNCGAKSPSITCPTFGWFHMNMSNADIRANVLRGCKLSDTFVHGAAQRSHTAEAENVDDVLARGDDADILESSGAVSDGTLEFVTETDKKIGEHIPPDFFSQRKFLSGPLLPPEVKETMRLLWKNEARLCSLICDIQHERLHVSGMNARHSMFFTEALLVPPIKFRPPAKSGDSVMEHPQTVLLGKVLQSNIALGNAHANSSDRSKIIPRWMDLQQTVNILYDSKTSGQRDNTATGICQLLEKKEGIFRQKMMGKRVNYACRSVISPDPYLAVNEIGIPPYFALRLTYPERVTPWNVNKLRDAIINGAEHHPGATHYVDKLATVKLPPSRKMRMSISRKLPSSRGAVTQPGKNLEYEFEGKVVYRHLQDGDIVLVNRQPTLHKPSIMAHVVRVLKGEKTIRMHYANCSTYNADFDGDEMNVHFPQDEISRAEAFNIVNANKQYVVPTSGQPIRGLIQDHIISAVLLTKRDTFLTRDEFSQLLYSSGVSATALGYFVGKPGQKISTINSEEELEPVLPAIWKPEPLWTGKQVITAVLNHITRGRTPFSVRKAGKTPEEYFGKTSGEYELLIHKNELVHGVIDKAQFGGYGLVHTVQELYGSNAAGVLLSVLSRLFTIFLQMHGFTCGIDDLLIVHRYDLERMKKLDKNEQIGEFEHWQFVGCADGDKDPIKLQVEIEKAIRRNGDSAVTRLDRRMSGAMNKLTSEVNKNLFPEGLCKPFPKNCLSLMTATGAKGGMVNSTQICSLLGQQELEGKRVPRMVSGKTLPCFPPWDPASRAGGFISDRFLTGLRPQEYYFHCMAGREGLVDTAVKTSRSGYLQRCLVKNLEGLKVCYDYTVRDADGSVVQFIYGEDGIDVHKTSFLEEFEALAANHRIVQERFNNQLDSEVLFKYDYIKKLPVALEGKAKDYIDTLSKKKLKSLNLRKRKDFMKLMRSKYISSLAQPGEPVGVVAAQSVGEPSTQMTLNTFHHAGRGEMNVTLGIPRLQEILMRASEKIQTPVMTCPLRKGKTEDDAKRLAAKLQKVTVADVIESMEVGVVPFSVKKHQVSTVYKLKLKLYPPELYPPYSGITLKDCQATLKFVFVGEMEDAIQSHLLMLSKIRGITNVVHSTQSNSGDGADEDGPTSKSQAAEENDDAGDDDDYEAPDDLGADAQKRKRQATDEMDYEDDMENEIVNTENGRSDIEASAGFESEIDQAEVEAGNIMDGEIQVFDAEDEASQTPSQHGTVSKSKSSGGKDEADARGMTRRTKKDSDRAFFMVAEGLDFEVHFRFTNEPHILLAQIAQKTAKNVYVKRSGNIELCSVVVPKKADGEPEIPELQTSGVDFPTFWNMQDDLDIRRLKSNDIHAVLNTYGVEAARATIIEQVNQVFKSYGIAVNIRHLSLIADFMTQTGGYRPMSRFGIAETISPFSKMSYETASRFVIEAAYHGEMDNLESPSARICLGLPVKMGTGCFDLMQKINI